MENKWELVIIGGGVAGMTAAQYGARANLRTLVIEEMAPGGQALLINDLENYPGFPEPVNGYEFSMDMKKQAEKFGAVIVSGTVKALEKKGDMFHIEYGDKNVTAGAVILATGAKHRHLGVPGEEEFGGRGVSYCGTCDGPFFKGQRILVVGGGDTACDEANYLAKLSDKVTIIHRRDRFRAQPAVAERVINNPNINVRFNKALKEIKGYQKVKTAIIEDTISGEQEEMELEAVFIFVGSLPQTRLVEDLEKDEAGYLVTNQRMETSTQGLFVAGDLRSSPFRQVVVACGEGATAAHCASQYIDDLAGKGYH